MAVKKPVIILAGGGHARVLVDALQAAGKTVIKGYTDVRAVSDFPAKYLGQDSILQKLDPRKVWLVNGLGSIALPSARAKLFNAAKAQGFRFLTVVHPTAYVAAGVQLGEGVIVMAGAVVQPGCIIEDNAVINTLAAIEHDTRIGTHTHVASGAIISGGVTVGADCHVGAGSCFVQGVAIAPKTLVAAGAVVTATCLKPGMLKGVPARWSAAPEGK